jgi:hypothetical protein
MPYYPILKAPGCTGWTTVCNYPPNNWEVCGTAEKFVNVTWAENGSWKTKELGTLAPEKMRTFSSYEIEALAPIGVLPLLSLTSRLLPVCSDVLPDTDAVRTTIPAWRATLGLKTGHASTSYQGEIDPFPVPGSLLTFSPFIQFGEGVENYLILLNLEASATSRTTRVEIYDSAKPEQLKGAFEAQNNNATVISLDGMDFEPDDLPVILCKGMSGIPLYFSRTSDGEFLSLEHTHPPASYVIHGKRWETQRILKNIWFAKVAQ